MGFVLADHTKKYQNDILNFPASKLLFPGSFPSLWMMSPFTYLPAPWIRLCHSAPCLYIQPHPATSTSEIVSECTISHNLLLQGLADYFHKGQTWSPGHYLPHWAAPEHVPSLSSVCLLQSSPSVDFCSPVAHSYSRKNDPFGKKIRLSCLKSCSGFLLTRTKQSPGFGSMSWSGAPSTPASSPTAPLSLTPLCLPCPSVLWTPPASSWLKPCCFLC